MTESLDLVQIERKAYLSYSDDGPIELLLGLAILAFSLGLAVGDSTVSVIIPAALAAIWPMVKKDITLPRIGVVRFGPERQNRLRKTKTCFVIIFIFTALLGVAAAWSFNNTTL